MLSKSPTRWAANAACWSQQQRPWMPGCGRAAAGPGSVTASLPILAEDRKFKGADLVRVQRSIHYVARQFTLAHARLAARRRLTQTFDVT
jgi:hypothetical protein